MEWQKRLYEHEQDPPADLWPHLSERLHNGRGRLAGRFADLEAAPPEDAWSAISKTVAINDTKGNGILRRLVGWTVPAAAACLAYLAIRFFAPVSPSGPVPSAAAALSRVGKSKKPQEPSDPGQKVTRNLVVPPVRESVEEPTPAVKVTAMARPAAGSRDANYIEVCDSSRLVCNRINYKLEGMAECLHAKGSLAGSGPCNRELQEWVDRMEHSNYVPAPGHFFDIVELAASLQGDR